MSIWIQEDITSFDNFWMKFGLNLSVCRLSKGCTIAQQDIHTYYIPRDMYVFMYKTLIFQVLLCLGFGFNLNISLKYIGSFGKKTKMT